MIKTLFVIGIGIFLMSVIPAFSEEKDAFQFKSNPEISNVIPKKSVRIKLERHGEGKYTWELTGDNVEEIIKTDRKLRKGFEVPQTPAR